MFKFVICNLNGSEITTEVNSNSKEILNICKLINQSGKATCQVLRHELDLFPDDWVTDYYTTDYDAVLVMNSNANFFGGVLNEKVIETFNFLAKNKKPIFYLFNDTNLGFRQLWSNICKRDWNRWTEDDVKITAPFYIISQFKNTQKVLELNSKDITPNGIKHIDFGTWLLYDYKKRFVPNEGIYDLIYGGSARGGKRKAKFDSYLDSTDIKVACYGSLKDKDIDCKTMPSFLGRKDSDKVIATNAMGFATIVVGEKIYNNDLTTIRIYESILAGCVTFIEDEFDRDHKIYDGYDYLYFSSKEELDRKIKELKANKEKYEEVQRVQLELLERNSKIDCIDQIIEFAKSIKE